MKIIVEGTPKEIAALVLELQERQIGPQTDTPIDSALILGQEAEKFTTEGEKQNGFYIG